MANTDDDNLAERLDDDTLGDDVGTLIDPTADVDDEPDAVATEARDADPLGLDVSTQDQGEVVPAEEAAMHITDAPPMGDGDGYLDD